MRKFMKAQDTKKNNRWRERGQSMVEFALSLTILLLLLAGIIDVARLWYIYIALEDAAGEGALYLSLNPTCSSDFFCANPNNATYRAVNATDIVTLDSTNIITRVYGQSVGSQVEVEVIYNDFEFITPILDAFSGVFGGTITLTGSAQQTIVGE
jgi:Flp pilus assembly protein TadG